jgi:hypothetical protein
MYDKSLSRRNIGLIILILIFFFASFYDSNFAFMLGFFLIPFGIIKLTIHIISSIKKQSMPNILLPISSIGLILCGPAGCAYSNKQVADTFHPIIQSLESYKARKGMYPNTLMEIGYINVLYCPSYNNSKLKRIFYVVDNTSDKYTLSCNTFVFNHRFYDSKTKEYFDWD